MIAHLNGSVALVEANSVILDVNGVGYRAFVPLTVLATLPAPGGKATLHTVMAVREDDITLYGFASPEERELFQVLNRVTGVGPKVALSMLSVMDSGELAQAITTSDVKALTKVPGVGPKLAQRIVYELGERVAEMAFARRIDALSTKQTPFENAAYEDVVEALVNLGYSRADSRKAAERAMSKSEDKTNVTALLRDTLNILTSR